MQIYISCITLCAILIKCKRAATTTSTVNCLFLDAKIFVEFSVHTYLFGLLLLLLFAYVWMSGLFTSQFTPYVFPSKLNCFHYLLHELIRFDYVLCLFNNWKREKKAFWMCWGLFSCLKLKGTQQSQLYMPFAHSLSLTYRFNFFNGCLCRNYVNNE